MCACRKNGLAMIWVMFILFIFLTLSASLAKILFSVFHSASSYMLHSQAFYLAESGKSRGLVRLQAQPSWYTDLPQSTVDLPWLVTQASGENLQWMNGRIKVVREKGKNQLYSIGYIGDNIQTAKALAVIEIRFSLFPLKIISWQSW